MNYTTLAAERDTLIQLFRNQRIYPILGAGFTAACQALDGTVPDGDTLKEEMLNKLNEIDELDTTALANATLKQLSKYYKELIPRETRTAYLTKHFTKIHLPNEQLDFLKINWKYIYTFNIDTAIEENSIYQNIILPNRKGDEKNISSMDNCLFKVHGDVIDYCKYADSNCYIFDPQEYARSIEENKFILKKIKHDFIYNNLLFVGCSLSEELDILSIDFDKDFPFHTTRYYVTTTKPNPLKEIDLKSYGITDVIIVESYTQFYSDIYQIYLDSLALQMDELSSFMNPSIEHLPQTYSDNKDYFYLGKLLYNTKTQKITIPSYYIDRTIISQNMLPDMTKYNIQILCGGRISGKTYALISVVKNVRDRDIYYFDSRYHLSETALTKLLERKNSIICFDTSSISKNQILRIEESMETLIANKLNIIVTINKSDKDIISFVNRLSHKNCIKLYELDNHFDGTECSTINQQLQLISIPNIDIKKTILDNLIISSKLSATPYKTNRDSFVINDIYSMMVFILLAINEKISSQEFVDYNIEREVYDILHKLIPIVDEDYTDKIERDSMNSSAYKLYANSRYWILSTLGTYATDYSKHELITSAYHRIIECLIQNHGTNFKELEDYIKYDVVNEIFFRPDRGNLSLIKALYDNLDDLLSYEPQFYHQKAKCYLWHSDYSVAKETELFDALRFAKLAKHNLELQGNLSNTKVQIALAHIDFTIALIYAKINSVKEYSDVKLFKECLIALQNGLTNEFNRDYFIGLMLRKSKNINDIKKFISYATTNDLANYELTASEQRCLNHLITTVINLKQ